MCNKSVSIVVAALLSYAFATGAGGRREFGHNSLSRHLGGTGSRYGSGGVSDRGARGEQGGGAVGSAYDVGADGFRGGRDAGAKGEHGVTVKGGYVIGGDTRERAGTVKGGYVIGGDTRERVGTVKGGYVNGGDTRERVGTVKGGYVNGGDTRENGTVKGGYVVDSARRELVETDRGGYEFGSDRRKNRKAVKGEHGDDGAKRENGIAVKGGYVVGVDRRENVKGRYGGDGQSFPPQTYQFDYEASDGQGNRHYRSERRDESGNVRGTYGYTDNQGLYRNVEYIADAGGYRANIKTNEPGTDGKENPAGVHLVVEKPPAGIQEKYDRFDGSSGGSDSRGTSGVNSANVLCSNVDSRLCR